MREFFLGAKASSTEPTQSPLSIFLRFFLSLQQQQQQLPPWKYYSSDEVSNKPHNEDLAVGSPASFFFSFCRSLHDVEQHWMEKRICRPNAQHPL